MSLNVMTGNRALLKLKGETIGVGLVQNIGIADDMGLQPISGIGKPTAVELVTGQVTHRITLSQFFVYNKKLIDMGYQPKKQDYLTSGEIDIEVLDQTSQTTLEHYAGCKMASCSRSYGKHAPSTTEATFLALEKIG